MAFLCVALLLSVADGQLHNPYSPLFENTLRQNQPGSSVKQASSPTLDVLFFMKSSADTTYSRPPSEQRETHGEGASAGSKSAELPPGLSKLFTSLVLPKPHSKRSLNVNTHSGTSPGYGENPLPNSDTTPTESSHTHSSDSTIAGNKVSLKLDSTTTGKSSRVNHGSNHENYRKIRRNRDRNHHRKTRQRHASLPQSKDKRVNSTTDTNIENINTRVNKTGQSLQRDTIADQHYRFLLRNTVFTRDNVDNVPQGTEKGPTPFSDQIQKVIEVESYTTDTMTKDKKFKVRKSLRVRRKRGTALPGQFSPLTGYAMGRDTLPGDTFFYRRPEGHSGALGRSHDTHSRPHDTHSRPHDTHSGFQPDPLVHSLEIENEEEDYQRPTPESPPIQASVELDEEEEEVQEKEADLGELQGEPEQDQAKTQEDVSDPMPSAAGENSTLNETLARQMFRSPMLVDYGSRVKPADVLQPTEADPEDPVLGGGDEEGDPLWTEEKALEEDISLEAESPKEKDPPKVPVVEPETEEEPTQEEPESEAIELPVIPQEPLSDLTSGAASEEAPEPAAEAESEAEPEAEPEAKLPELSEPEGETEPESSSEPEQEKPEGEPVDSHPYAEPQPEWEEAKKVWGPWWEIHIYGIGLAFAVLCVYSFVSVLRLWQKKNLLSQGYFIALNAIMFLMGAFRAVYFLVDGYNAQGSFHIAGNYFLYSIGFPCLTSAFSILLLALLQTLKMQILSPKIQRTRVVIGIIAAHFLLSIVTDIVVGYLYSAKIMLFVCQVATVFWGLVLFIGYIYVFRKLYKAAKWRQNEMMRLSLAKFKLDGISPITKAPRLTLNMAVKITLATSVFGLILAGLQTYGIVGVYSIFSTDVPNPWTWLVFNTGMRLTELAMCITMSYVATQPFRYNPNMKGGEHRSPSCFSNFIYMAPCRRIFECDSVSLHDDDLSWNDLPVHGDHGEMDNNGAHVISEEATPMTANGRAAHAAAAAAVANHNEREGSSSSKRSNKVAARPASLLVSDNGFIRFREDGEMGGSPVLLSTDDELENISGDNMIRNPFYRDLLRRQEKERAVGRATFVNSDGITLQDEFGLVESVHDPELVPPPRPTYPVRGYGRGCSYPNTGTNTPGTPRSFCSTDLEYAASEISYRPPSSIHLRDSIENALNIPGFTLRTPDILDSPLNAAYLRTRRGSLMATRGGARPMGTGSMSDLESLRHYGPGSRYGDSEDTMDTHPERAASPDSMYSYTLSNLTRAPLVRSYSDSIGKASQPEVSYPNSPERRYYKDRLRASMLRNHPENAHQFQNLLKNINDMCNVYNKLSPDDREGDE